MKRKYAAMILGMALAVSSISVCAESVDTAADAAVENMTEDVSLAEDAGAEYYGEITEIGEDTITVSVGLPMEEKAEKPERENGDDTLAGVDASASSEEASDAEHAQDDADTQDAAAQEEADTKAAADVQDGEDTENTEDAREDAQNGLDAADAKPAGILLEFTGEERAVTITEDTLLLREEQPKPMERPEEPADESVKADAEAESRCRSSR